LYFERKYIYICLYDNDDDSNSDDDNDDDEGSYDEIT
jgi:hypothetical protein